MSPITFNLLGPQGSGKGTQAKTLTDHFDLVHFDAGEALREIRATGSTLGLEIASYIEKGSRVPPQLIADVTYQALKDVNHTKDILFDGLLRSLDELKAQHDTFEKLELPLPVIIFLNLDEETAIKRLANRRICANCHRRFTIADDQDLADCLACGGKLETRHDDTPDAIKERLRWYHADTLPVVDYFRKNGTVIDINASPDIETVSSEVVSKVEDYYRSINRPLPSKEASS